MFRHSGNVFCLVTRSGKFNSLHTTSNALKDLKDPNLLRVQALINGTWRSEASTGDTFSVHDPATLEKLVDLPCMGREDTQLAIEAARDAATMWQGYTPLKRSKILKELYRRMIENQDDLARLMTAESGKPLEEARGEVLYGAGFVEFFAHECIRNEGFMIPTSWQDSRLLCIKQPVGVTAIITPWNFPLAMITRKLGPALAAGCTAVIKPSEETPLSALAIAFLAERAGIPPGVVNVITGSREKAADIGHQLATSDVVRKVSFTGSTSVGKTLMSHSASTVKKISLELGGNAPFIVFEDADVDKAVAGAIASKFRNTGQTCVCSNRLYVHRRIHDEFCNKLVKEVSKLKVGHGFDLSIQQGPLINAAGFKKVNDLVNDAVKKGANVLVGGRPHSLGLNFYEPTVLSNLNEGMAIQSTEIFGPVAAIYDFDSEAEVIQMANSTKAGLAGYFYSRDIGRIWRVAEALEFGMVGVNTGIVSTVQAPFGGVKESGLGREGSILGMDEYTETKYICMSGLDS